MLIIIFMIPVPQVVDGKLLMNPNISYQLQDIFNLLSDVTNPVFVHSLQVETNDQMLAMYIAPSSAPSSTSSTPSSMCPQTISR